MQEELTEQELRERAALVAWLGSSLNSKETSLDAVLTMTKQLIATRAWTHFLTKVDEEVTYPDTPEGFIQFITTPRISGLGTTPEVVERNIKDDEEALRMYHDAKKLPVGGDYTSQHAKEHSFTNNISKASKSRNTIQGTSKSYGLEVLHDKHPEQYERVKRKEVSVNKALVEVGERKPMATVPLHSMSRLAGALRRRLDDEELAELISLLLRDEDSEV